jgi:acyl-[acyl-carrier-protein]-phospholipid O-acyltransferase/long-chain-fatty-acid--[acyl-carrier-protein] ligase
MSTPPLTDLDQMIRLPDRNRTSISLVMAVQTLNSFNDNFVKMLLISLAITVAKGTLLGDNMEILLVVIFSLPYILFAPVAGWLSDRLSKRDVIMWMQVAQLGCFAVLAIVLLMKDTYWSLLLSLGGFFLLATQATFLSPAKMGMMKEIAGSRRLGIVSGWLQMTMMAGVLSGIWAGGEWFAANYERSGDAWTSALWPLVVIAVLGVGELIAAWAVQPTPPHPDMKFKASVLWEHFAQLKLVFKERAIRLAAIGINFFWFVSNAVGLIVVTLAKEMHPGVEHGGGASTVGKLAGLLGIGVVAGSAIAGALCRKRIEMGLIPLSGLGMTAGLLWAGLAPLDSFHMYAGLFFTGAAGGAFMVPLYAYVQDRAPPELRARILAGINLMDCLGVFMVAGIVFGMKAAGLTASQQLMALAAVALFATVYTTRLLPQHFVRFICTAIVRSLYHVKAVNPQHVPSTGGVLLLPNHVSYVDALVLSVACERNVRFVMWDVLYKVWWMNGFLRLFGTVPISSTRAKDAVRTVVEALKAGECVCLFPEGQLTRLGLINEVRKGFELMVRQAGVPVVPVYQDGLWGSVFSYEGKGAFKKWPKRLRYPVRIHFGAPIPPAEARTPAVREAMLALGSEAMLTRNPQADIAAMNAMRLACVPPHDAGGRHIDPATGAVIAAQLPDPALPAGEEELQRGKREGTLGRLLPGLAAKQTPEGLHLRGLAPGDSRTVFLAGAVLDAEGFIVPASV